MKNLYVLAILFLSLLLSVTTSAVPGSLTYQGRIITSDGLPLQVNGVKFEFSITNPTGSCTLYRETSTAVDMRNSNGVFDVPIGTGTKNFPLVTSFKLLDTFDNDITFTCESGGTYVPLTDDKRLLRVQFYDGSGWKLISPDNEIRSVPFAGHSKVAQSAHKLGTNVVDDFVLKSNVPLCGAGQYLRHIAPLGTFECTAPTVNGGNVTGNISGSSAGFTGILAGDVSGTQGATSVDKIKGVAVDMTGIGLGKVLKYNGTSWVPANDDGTTGALTGLTGDVTSTGSPTATVTLSDGSVATNKIADGAVTSIKISDGTIVDADISASANIADTKLATISTAGKVSGNAITSGTISGTTSINTSGTVTATGVSSGTISANTLQIYKTGNGNKVTITVPTALSPDYSLQLPGNAGLSGQVLSTDGSGVLFWATPSSGSVTSVGATAPLSSTGGVTPVISLTDSGVTAGTYAKVTVNSKGLVTTGTSLGSADIPNLSGDVTSTSGAANTKVEKIQGVAVSSTTPLSGQVLVYGGVTWAPQYFGMGELRSTVTGTSQVPASCATADKTLTWSAITDSFVCTTISIANTQVTGLGTAATKNFGTAAGNLVELNGTGKIPASLIPQGASGFIVDGGNSTGATLAIGTNDANSLALKTNNATQMTITSSGNVGIGTTSPQSLLHVSGGVQIGLDAVACAVGKAGTIRYNGGNVEYCNGTSWTAFAASGSSITSLNGLTTNTQTFSVPGTSGTAPGWVSSGSAHTLNIPMANTALVTAGLISKTEYDTFNNKLGAIAGSTLADGKTWVGNATNQAVAVTMSGDATLSNTGVLTLANTVVAGTGTKVTYDAKGRVTASTSLAAGDIPNLDWTKITTGKPTTLGGYGITDAVSTTLTSGKILVGDISNVATAVTMSGDATLSNAGSLTLNTVPVAKGGTGLIALGTANQVLGVNNVGTAAEYKTITAGTGVTINNTAGAITINATGSGGTVTSITAGTGLTGGTITGSGTIGLGTELTGLNALATTGFVKRTGAGTYSTTATANLASDVSGVLPIANGGTNSSTALINNRLMASSGGAIVELGALSDGQIVVGKTAMAPQVVTLGGDATISNIGSLTIANAAINSAKIADGTVGVADLNFAGTMATNTGVVVRDGTQFFNKTCAGNEVLIWSVANGWICSAVILSETDPKVGANTTNYLSKWNGSALVTSGVFENSGNIGIGTSNPQRLLHMTSTSPEMIFEESDQAANSKMWRIWSSNGQLSFQPLVDAIAGSPSPAMEIARNGNVGIGTTTPATLGDGDSAKVLQIHQVGGQSAVSLSTDRTVSGVFAGTLSFGTMGTASADKRSALISSTLTAASGTNVTGDLRFYTNNIGTIAQRMVIEAGGNVGIGATTPSRKLDVAGTIAATGSDALYTTNGWLRGIELPHATAIVWKKGVSDKSWSIGKSDVTSNFYIANSTADDNSAAANYPFVVNSGGNVGIGTAAPSFKLDVAGTMRAITTGTAIVGTSSTGYGVYGESNNYGIYGKSLAYGYGGVLGYDYTGSYYGILGLNGASGAWAFYGAGSAYVSGTYQGSDRRLKEHIAPLHSALNMVNRLEPVSFDWKENTEQRRSIKGKDFGFIAQDVEKIFPEMVREVSAPDSPAGANQKKTLNQELGKFKTVEYTRFIPWLAQAIKELYQHVTGLDAKVQKQLADQQAQIRTIQSENEELKKRLERLERLSGDTK